MKQSLYAFWRAGSLCYLRSVCIISVKRTLQLSESSSVPLDVGPAVWFCLAIKVRTDLVLSNMILLPSLWATESAFCKPLINMI